MLVRTIQSLMLGLALCCASTFAQTGGDIDPTVDLPEPNGSVEERSGSHWLGREMPGRAKFIRSHWVRLSPDGSLNGKISLLGTDGQLDGASSLEVNIYRKGDKVATAQTDEDGKFRVEQLDPGVYAIIAKGANGFVAYGLHALRSDRQAQSDPIRLVQAVEIGETVNISTAAVPPSFAQLRGILSDNFDRIRSNFVPPSEYASLLEEAKQEQMPGSDEPEGAEQLRGTEELQRNPTTAGKTIGATSISVHDVILEPARGGWMMKGRLYGIDPDTGRSVEIEAGSTEVTLIQNDERVDSDTVSAEGEFDFYGLEEGVYSLIAIGEGGFGAVAFRAVIDRDAEARAHQSNLHFVQFGPNVNGPQLDNFGGGNPAIRQQAAPVPFALALIDEPRAIRDAVRPAGIAGMQLPGPAQMPFAGNQIVGDQIIQPGESFPMNQSFPGQPAVNGNSNAFNNTSGGFSNDSGGGGSSQGGGGLLGIASIATGIALSSALDDNNSQPQGDATPVSPFAVQ